MRLETADTVLEKIVYVLANPVAAGLVRRGSDWPGLWSDPTLIGGEGLVFERPKDFFRADGPLPATARLRFHPPPGFEDPPELVAELLSRLRTPFRPRGPVLDGPPCPRSPPASARPSPASRPSTGRSSPARS